ncbi:hypothetical protein EMPG_14830 [Blastomyces silverae]|uniref:Uncharacterized protein n=1 Tax=Blastomyces silverae TaxID=2060906 RepID=A0A0H1BEE8_9EURO|nr:hypothetical protein EMPG_14830 [Blastomyces silverae]
MGRGGMTRPMRHGALLSIPGFRPGNGFRNRKLSASMLSRANGAGRGSQWLMLKGRR